LQGPQLSLTPHVLPSACAALHALLVGGDGTAAAQWLADMATELQRAEPNNAELMVQLVSTHSTPTTKCRHSASVVSLHCAVGDSSRMRTQQQDASRCTCLMQLMCSLAVCFCCPHP
jgi:hypothetical protein